MELTPTARRERPILFSAPMVRAILAGKKTQTRRVARLTWAGHVKEPRGHRRWHPLDDEAWRACPYGTRGDRLWVRETWAIGGNEDGHPVRHDGSLSGEREAVRLYRADTKRGDYGLDTFPNGAQYLGRWRPSIHMPRWASRITLEIEWVLLERLQELEDDGAQAEGIHELPGQEGEPGAWWTGDPKAGRALHARSPSVAFRLLWESINGKRAPWSSNPWVWVVAFRVLAPAPGGGE